jgi:hypothetical protein
MPGISVQDWDSTLISSSVDGAAMTAAATATSLLPAASRLTIAPNFFTRAGQMLRVKATGRVSNIVTTPGTLTLAVALGPTSNIAAWSSGTIALNTTAKTNVSWVLDLVLTLRAAGSGTSANFIGIGTWASESVVGAGSGTALSALCPASAPAVGTGFDSTVTNILDLQATMSLTGNSITCHQFDIEAINS